MSDLLTRLTSALADRYAVERELGAGGMAVVFLADDLKHHRKVAIKVLRPELSESLGGDRFLKEIETAAGLSHPHILPVHDSGEADGLLYYVMPFVEGETLQARIEREQQLPINDALEIAREIAEALSYAHSYGIVHRDIKPDNVMLYGGHAVIADFGIAKAVSAAGGEKLTGTGMAIGTPQYMSPEQASGDEVDARSDVYALACLTYEMLVGEPPFTGRNVQAIVQQHIAAPPPSASTIRPTTPPDISLAIQRAMAKTPADRYSTAGEFAEALKGTRDGIGAYLRSLVRRRVPHVLGVYALLSVGVTFLIGFLIDRLVLSPHLTGFGIVALASLLPAVAIVAYFRGRAWTWKAKMAIPANLVASALLLLLVFGTKDLGAATTTVTVEDEEGNTIERVVPKSEFRKRLVIFFFDNETGDSTSDWLQYGIPLALDLDLTQDLFIQTRTAEEFAEEFKKAGYAVGVALPLTFRRQLADEQHVEYFVSGSFSRENGDFLVTVTLHETRRSRLLAERQFSGSDIFALADEMAVQLKHDLKIPTQYIEEVEDLPVADMLTSSILAYEHMIEGYKALTWDEDWETAAQALEASVSEDPTNAFAHLVLYIVSLLRNDRPKAQAAIESALQHSYKLPERAQYDVKAAYYDFNQQPDKVLAIYRMKVELLPDDIEGRAQLASLVLLLENDRDAAAAQYERILEIDPTQYEYLQQLGTIAQAKGEFQQAIGYYEQYATQFPDDPDSYKALASVYRVLGEHEQAKDSYDRALLAEPDNISVLTSLAQLERHFGNFEAEIVQLESALERSKTPQERSGVLGALKGAYEWRGQMQRAIEYMHQGWDENEKFAPPVAVMLQRLGALDTYIKGGEIDVARTTFESIGSQLTPPWDALLAIGELGMALELDDADAADAALPGVESFIETFGVESLRSLVVYARGRISELREQYEDAIASYQEQLERDPSDISTHTEIGRCYRELGELDAAEEHLLRSLMVSPFSPTIHYQLALVFADRGERDQALQHLETALEVWKDADPAFKPAREAREKLDELKPTS